MQKKRELKGRTKIIRLWESEEKETQIGGGWPLVTGNRSVLCIYWGSLLRSWIQVCHSWVCAYHIHWTRGRYSQRKRRTHLAEVKSNKVQAAPTGCGYVWDHELIHLNILSPCRQEEWALGRAERGKWLESAQNIRLILSCNLCEMGGKSSWRNFKAKGKMSGR